MVPKTEYTNADLEPLFYGPHLPTEDPLKAEVGSVIDEDLGIPAFREALAEEAKPSTKAFDAYMILDEDLELGQHRLLETDNVLLLPS